MPSEEFEVGERVQYVNDNDGMPYYATIVEKGDDGFFTVDVEFQNTPIQGKIQGDRQAMMVKLILVLNGSQLVKA